MVFELIFCTCQTSRITYFLALTVLYNVIETLYSAYYYIGMTAYIFVLISYLPFIISLLRMACRDTENRRLIFYRTSLRLWMAALAIDIWVLISLNADIDEQCEIVGYMPNADILTQAFGGTQITNQTLIQLCKYRAWMATMVNMSQYHIQYCFLCFISRTFWRSKR